MPPPLDDSRPAINVYSAQPAPGLRSIPSARAGVCACNEHLGTTSAFGLGWLFLSVTFDPPTHVVRNHPPFISRPASSGMRERPCLCLAVLRLLAVGTAHTQVYSRPVSVPLSVPRAALPFEKDDHHWQSCNVTK